MPIVRLLPVFVALGLWTCPGVGPFAIPANAQEFRFEPEAATGQAKRPLAIASRYMIAAAHPLAAEAGRDILERGGSAVDAAIAAQLVLGLVEPQSSGLGGGAFLVHWNEAERRVVTYDGRETAPAAARPDRFMRDGRPMGYRAAVRSGLSVGVPGVVRMLAAAHAKHGRLAWAALFEPAIALAEGGFPVSRRLHLLLTWQGASHFAPGARAYFFDPAGAARPIGHVLKNPDYAVALKILAEQGADAFYQGRIAEDIVAAVAAAADNPGDMTMADLAAYAAKSRDALCVAYRSKQVCGMGPPSSGMTAVGQILKLIEPLPGFAPGQQRMSAEALHALAEAQKLAYADRGRYIADPDFVAVPAGLLDDDYLADRRRLIRMDQPMARPEAGVPPGVDRRAFGRDTTREATGTSHLSIIDGDGNAVSMTTTIESAFGSGLWAAGFLLNNELTDFALRPADASGVAAANRVEGGKRPRSSMAPTMVFDDQGRLEIVTGSPGGPRIIQYVAKTLVAMIDWDMDAQSAAELINFGSSGGTFDIEMGWPGYGVSSLWPALQMKGLGHRVATRLMTSGVHTVARRGGRLEGGADPRREGVALGDE